MNEKYCYEYPRPSVTTDCLVFKYEEGKVKLLLIKRKNEPFKGMWAFPGGFLDMDEDSTTGAARELKEETGIICNNLLQLHIADKVDRDPRGRILSIIYASFLFDNTQSPQAMDDAAAVQWHDINNLPELAGDHKEILKKISTEITEGLTLGLSKFNNIKKNLTKTEIEGTLLCFQQLVGM